VVLFWKLPSIATEPAKVRLKRDDELAQLVRLITKCTVVKPLLATLVVPVMCALPPRAHEPLRSTLPEGVPAKFSLKRSQIVWSRPRPTR
jgi:hypothetical protein